MIGDKINRIQLKPAPIGLSLLALIIGVTLTWYRYSLAVTVPKITGIQSARDYTEGSVGPLEGVVMSIETKSPEIGNQDVAEKLTPHEAARLIEEAQKTISDITKRSEYCGELIKTPRPPNLWVESGA